MNSEIYSRTEVFADWLDVTFSPDLTQLREDFFYWMDLHCFPLIKDKDGSRYDFAVGTHGKLVYDRRSRFQRLSASGGVVAYLRENGLWRDYVNFIGNYEHKVTRLDAAVDVFRDAPDVLEELELRYPEDVFHFGRKASPITHVRSRRASDNRSTGTFYVGHRTSSRVKARVYDKQDEALEKRNEELPPTTRYELIFGKDLGVSLWDALMPRDLFYTFANSTLLEADCSYDVWESRGLVPWASVPINPRLTLEQFERRLECSPDLDHLIEIVDGLGAPAKALLMRRFEMRLDSVLASKASSEDVA